MVDSPSLLVEVYYRPHQKDGEGTVFTGVCVCPHWGWGYPSPRFFPRSLVPGPFPGQWFQVLSRGYPSPSQEGHPRYPHQVMTGTSWPGQDGSPSPPPARRGLGYPSLPARSGWGTPPPGTEQQSEYLLCGGWYASCVHAGGRSCLSSCF